MASDMVANTDSGGGGGGSGNGWHMLWQGPCPLLKAGDLPLLTHLSQQQHEQQMSAWQRRKGGQAHALPPPPPHQQHHQQYLQVLVLNQPQLGSMFSQLPQQQQQPQHGEAGDDTGVPNAAQTADSAPSLAAAATVGTPHLATAGSSPPCPWPTEFHYCGCLVAVGPVKPCAGGCEPAAVQ
jgi:hypothetical protein